MLICIAVVIKSYVLLTEDKLSLIKKYRLLRWMMVVILVNASADDQ